MAKRTTTRIVHRFQWSAKTELQITPTEFFLLWRAAGIQFEITDERFQALPEPLREKIKPYAEVKEMLCLEL